MESLEKSTKELKVVEDELFQKSKVLNAIIDELNILTSQFENAKTQLTDLSTSIENIYIKSNRAVRLVEGLKSEEKRWKENIKILQNFFQIEELPSKILKILMTVKICQTK